MARKPTHTDNASFLLSEAAIDALSLSGQPFTQDILADESIYIDASLKQLEDTIKHLLQFSDLLITVEGDAGSGRTTLFRHLLTSEIPNIFLMPVPASATDTLVQLQQSMSIHLKEHGDANHLEDNLRNLKMFDQIPVLAIDDAHVLSDTTLQELLRYQQQLKTEYDTQLKILLLANNGMGNTLEQVTGLQHQEITKIDMPGLTPKQILAYIDFKLALVGYNGPMPLTQEDIKQIYTKTGGNPLQVMHIASRYLEKFARRKSRSSGLPVSRLTLVGALLVLVLLVTGTVAYFAFMKEPATLETAITTPESVTPSLPPAQPEDQPAPASTQTPAADDTQTSETDTSPATVTETASTLDTEADTTEPQTDVTQTQPQPTPGPAPSPEATGSTQPNTPVAETTPPPTETTPAATTKPEPAKSQPPAPKPSPAKTSPKPETSAAVPSPRQQNLTKLEQLGLHGPKWLLQQDDSRWTIQILAARDPATLLKFAHNNHLGRESAWYQTRVSNKPLYILVHRNYADHGTASQAIATLPEVLQRQRPWVKSLAAVKKSIRASRP